MGHLANYDKQLLTRYSQLYPVTHVIGIYQINKNLSIASKTLFLALAGFCILEIFCAYFQSQACSTMCFGVIEVIVELRS